jgi:hypothetical protein
VVRVVLALALAFTLLLSSLLLFALAINMRRPFADGIFHITHELLRFAFDLLRGAFNLFIAVAGPFADLAFRTTRSIVHRTFNLILIHMPPPWFVASVLSSGLY